MSKTPELTLPQLHTAVTNSARTGEIVFLPTPNQRAIKARFWKRLDHLAPKEITKALAVQIAGPGISRWWDSPGFREWFSNKEEAAERLEYLYMLALDTAEELLLNPDAQASAKVNLIKILAQLAGKEPQKEVKFADEAIGKMSREQLEAYIRTNAPKLLKAEPEVESGEDK
jgi:hypothetical protein